MLTDADKARFYHDGFLVLPGIVPDDRVRAARRLVNAGLGGLRSVATTEAMAARAQDRPISNEGAERIKEATFDSLRAGTDPAILDLVADDSALMATINELLGPVREITGAQLATSFPTDPGPQVNESGYPDEQTPFFAWHGHLDGLWNGATAIHQRLDRPMNDAEWNAWLSDPSRNGGTRVYEEHGTTITNFTALLGVPLSDQTEPGCGNLGLLKGAHHEIEKFFQFQRDAGGPLGPDGPDWPRFDRDAPNGAGLRHYPERVREAFAENAERTADGRLWPRPTLVQAAPGDAVLVLHATPHCATRVSTSDPRMMVYFRLTAANRPEGNERIFPDALCDIWLEWQGMRETVARLRAEPVGS